MVQEPSEYPAISSYALIGDCHSAALVSDTGSIDWACLRRFDSGAVFCRLLDAKRGGSFRLRAVDPISSRRAYVRDTNVLETVFETKQGRARLFDCFTMRRGGSRSPYRQLLRVIEGMEGEVSFDVVIEPRFDYGALPPWLREHRREGVFSAVGGDDALVITADCPLSIDYDAVRLEGHVVVQAKKRCRFSLVGSLAHEIVHRRVSDHSIDQRLERTIVWWRDWVNRGRYPEEYRDIVVRSALVLKALTCAPTGAIVAAPTTSLPEGIGEARNWDYRYSWIRDSTLVLSALFSVGHLRVAQGFKLFVERTTAGRAEDLQIMYSCYGERRLPELELDHLEGYRRSKPVRVGNASAKQRQLDVFGELVDAWHLWTEMGNRVSNDEWRFLSGLIEGVRRLWREPDCGLWEIRGTPIHFVHSKVMCWVALERGIELAERQGLPCDIEAWRQTRGEIRKTIEEQGIDHERGCFVQAFGSRELDASLLLLPMVGFVDACDPRMFATVEWIEKELGGEQGLIKRYKGSIDGLHGEEGYFLMVSFWLVVVLAMQGRVDEAESRFRSLLALANDLGLFSEEYDPRDGQLGNFPQAFTHVSVIEAAHQLADAKLHGPCGQSALGHRAARRHRRHVAN